MRIAFPAPFRPSMAANCPPTTAGKMIPDACEVWLESWCRCHFVRGWGVGKRHAAPLTKRKRDGRRSLVQRRFSVTAALERRLGSHHGCSTIVLTGFTCPATTVVTVASRALDRVRERVFGLLCRSIAQIPARQASRGACPQPATGFPNRRGADRSVSSTTSRRP